MTNYYVDAGAGDDSGTGLSGDPWKTLAKVNTEFNNATFVLGDAIYFNRGDTWNITTYSNNLYIRKVYGSSGTLTIGAYGAGADPIFDCGSNNVPAIYTNESFTANYFIVEYIECTDATQALVWLRDSSNFTLRYLTVHDTTTGGGSSPAIYCNHNCQDFVIHDCEIYDTAGEGVYLGTWNDASDNTDRGEIYNNTIYDIGNEGIDCKFCTTYMDIHDNVFTNCYTNGTGNPTYQAIKLGGQYHTVTSNTIRDMAGRVGIGTAYQGVGYSIDTAHMTIEYNKVDTADYGIHIRGASGDVFDDADINYNELTNCSRCVFLYYSTGIDLSYNDLCSDGYGIYAQNGDPDSSDYNWFGTELSTHCYYSAANKTRAQACADVGLECNSTDGKSDQSDVYTGDGNFVSYWRMEEATGANRADSVGSNTLTDNNTVVQSADQKEGTYAADFEKGNSEYLSITDAAQTGLDITADISICFWMKAESLGDQGGAGDSEERQIVAKYEAAAGERGYRITAGSAADQIRFSLATNGDVVTTAYTADGTISAGTYYHVACVYNSADMRVYINGVLATNSTNNPKTYANGINANSADFRIGVQDGGSYYYDGLIDAAAIFDRELDPWEVAAIYENGFAAASASPSPSASASASPSATPSPSASLSPSASASASPSASPSPSEAPPGLPAAAFTSLPTALGLPTYEIWLTTDGGVRIALLDSLLWFNASRAVNAVGWFEAGLPTGFDTSLIAPDRMVQIWRAPIGGSLSLWRVYFIRKWRFETGQDGDQAVIVSGPDSNDLLRRRIVVGYATSTYASKTDFADDMMKELVTEAMRDTPTPTPDAGTREWDNLSVANVLGDGPTLTRSFNFGRLLLPSGGGVLADIAKSAREAGTEVFFDVVPVSVTGASIAFQFRTYTGQPGADISNRLVFDQARGNLKTPMLEYDYTEEINYVYAGGQGEEADRNFQQVYDSARYGLSQWNRCEGFADARNEEADNGVREAGRALLEEGRPRQRFSGMPIDTAATRFGKDWNFGDKVRARYHNTEFDAIIRAVAISRDSSGETIQARLDYES